MSCSRKANVKKNSATRTVCYLYQLWNSIIWKNKKDKIYEHSGQHLPEIRVWISSKYILKYHGADLFSDIFCPLKDSESTKERNLNLATWVRTGVLGLAGLGVKASVSLIPFLIHELLETILLPNDSIDFVCLLVSLVICSLSLQNLIFLFSCTICIICKSTWIFAKQFHRFYANYLCNMADVHRIYPGLLFVAAFTWCIVMSIPNLMHSKGHFNCFSISFEPDICFFFYCGIKINTKCIRITAQHFM